MKVLLVNGSPHKDGCTNRALEEISQALNEEGIDTEIIWIGNKPISGCIACRSCITEKKCVFDDIVNEFVDKAKKADGFIFGTPVYYAAVSGSLTSFMDRVFYSASLSRRNVFKYKPAAGICSARRAGTTSTYDQLNKYFGINQMPIISSRYWNMVFGNIKEEVEKDLEGMQVMRMLGYNMAYFLKCIDAGKKAGIKIKKEDSLIPTNFIR